MKPPSREIRCTACGQTTLARAEPVYDGFKKIGEAFLCTGCGARYASAAETPFAAADARPRVFTEQDQPARPVVFREEERRHSCGWCRHFVVNPFAQRCGLTNRHTEATDLCVHFESKPPTEPAGAPPDESGAPPRES